MLNVIKKAIDNGVYIRIHKSNSLDYIAVEFTKILSDGRDVTFDWSYFTPRLDDKEDADNVVKEIDNELDHCIKFAQEREVEIRNDCGEK